MVVYKHKGWKNKRKEETLSWLNFFGIYVGISLRKSTYLMKRFSGNVLHCT